MVRTGHECHEQEAESQQEGELLAEHLYWRVDRFDQSIALWCGGEWDGPATASIDESNPAAREAGARGEVRQGADAVRRTFLWGMGR